MTAPRLLIVTASQLCRCPRAVKEANTLAAAGYDVTVTWVSRTARFDALDEAIASALPIRRAVIDLSGATRFGSLRLLRSRLMTKVARLAAARLGVESPAALGPAQLLWRSVERHPADLTILHQELPLCLGARLARAGRRFAADIEDWYSEDLLPADRSGRPVRLLQAAEAFALRRAAWAAVPSRSMANALAARYGTPAPTVIRNTFPLPPRIDRATGRPPGFVWFSQTIGPGRGLERFLGAWNQMRSPTVLTLIGDVRPGFEATLRNAVSADRQHALRLAPFVEPAELPNALSQHDIGLALEEATPPSRDLTITNKVLQYLGGGLAVVATGTTGQREALADAGDAALFIGDATDTELARRLDTFVADEGRLGKRRQAARALAEAHFDWDRHDAAQLRSAVSSALAAPVALPSV